MQKHIKQNISDRTTIPNSQVVNSVSNNLQSVDQVGFKRSQKSFFTTNEDFTQSNSRLSKLMNQVQYLGSDCEDEPQARVRVDAEFPDAGVLADEATLGESVWVTPEEAHLDHDFENLNNHFDLNMQNEDCETQNSGDEQPEEDRLSHDDQRFADTMNQFSKLVNSVHNEYFHEMSSENQLTNTSGNPPIDYEEIPTDFETINNYYNTEHTPVNQGISGMLNYRGLYTHSHSHEDHPQVPNQESSESAAVLYSNNKSDNSVVIICEKELSSIDEGRTCSLEEEERETQPRIPNVVDGFRENFQVQKSEENREPFNFPKQSEEPSPHSSEICCNLVKNLSEVLLKVDEEEQKSHLKLSNDLKMILSPEAELLYKNSNQNNQESRNLVLVNKQSERNKQKERNTETSPKKEEMEKFQINKKNQEKEIKTQKNEEKRENFPEKIETTGKERIHEEENKLQIDPIRNKSLVEISKRIEEYHLELSNKMGLEIVSNTSFIKNKAKKPTTSKVIFKIWKKYNYENRWGTEVKVRNKGKTMQELDQLAENFNSPEKTKIRFSIPEKEIFSLVKGMHSSTSPEGKIELDSKSFIKMTESLLKEKITVYPEFEISEKQKPRN